MAEVAAEETKLKLPAPESDRIHSRLKQYFGYSTLKPFQQRVVSAAVSGRDAFVLQATGSGKSLCYQLPPLVLGKTCIVISPLISLMQDQVHAMREQSIAACHLSGGGGFDQAQIERDVLAGRYSLVYLTAEKLPYFTAQLKTLHKQHGIGLVAVDEAHCVSEWGHDFRPDYRRIHTLRDALPDVTFMCLTATATPRVQKDIVANMRLKDPVVETGSFDRPNLSYTILRKCGRVADMKKVFAKVLANRKSKKSESLSSSSSGEEEHEDDEDSQDEEDSENEGKSEIKEFKNTEGKELKEHKKRKNRKESSSEGMTVVYCNTKKETEAVANCICELGVKAVAYHAGLNAELRQKIHDDFIYDRIEALVATTAFGMGIDKPDIRRVVHYGAPKSIETYYQQTGRAGRDGAPAECIMFWSPGDFTTNARLIELSAANGEHKTDDEKRASDAALKQNRELLTRMKDYTTTMSRCRRRLLLEYFGETPASPTCYACDNCLREKDASQSSNCGRDALLLLQAVDATGGRFGLAVPADVLVGSGRKQIKERGFEQLPCYGAGRHHSSDWWKQLARVLIDQGLLMEKSRDKFVTTCTLDSAGRDFLSKYRASPESAELVVQLPAEMEKKSRSRYGSGKGSTKEEKKTKKRSSDSKSESSSGSSSSGLPAEWSDAERSLYNVLVTVRTHAARAKGVPPFMVFHNKHLQDMVRRRPTTTEGFLACEGVGVAKGRDYGPEFLKAIEAHCTQYSMKTNCGQAKEEKVTRPPKKPRFV